VETAIPEVGDLEKSTMGFLVHSFLNSVDMAFLHGYKTSMRDEYLYGDPEWSFRNHRLSIHYFYTIFTLTYKIPLSYTPTVEKEILINCRQGEVERVKEVFDERVQRVWAV
jgi:hypothetical protein